MKRILILAGLISLSGCVPRANSVGDICWAPATKQGVTSLIKEAMLTHTFNLVNSEKKQTDKLTAEQKDQIANHWTVKVEDFVVRTANLEVGSYGCGAKMFATFSNDKHTASTDGNIFEFSINRSESGNYYGISGIESARLRQAVLDIDKKLGEAEIPKIQ